MRSKLLSVTVIAFAAVFLAAPVLAQGKTKILRLAPGGAIATLAPDPAEFVPGGNYPPQALESLRGELLELVDTVQEFAAVAPADSVDLAQLQQARMQILAMPPEYLNTIRRGIDPAKIQARLIRARMAVADYQRTRDSAPPIRPMTSGFPNANGFCTSGAGDYVTRIPTAVVLAADVVWYIADSVRECAQDACKQVAVVLGEGGNTSLACIAVDVVWVVAKALVEGIHFCDDDLTGAVVDANYARLDHVHTDVAGVSTQVTNHDTHLTNVDTHITNQLTALDTHMTQLYNLLAAQIGQVQDSVDLANQRLLITIAGEKQIMRLELTPEGRRQIVQGILTCTGSNCPDVLLDCPSSGCSWNNVGP